MKNHETRSYKITGTPEQLDNLEKIFGCIEYWGKIGHSGNILLFADGDGCCRMTFEGVDRVVLPEDFKYQYIQSQSNGICMCNNKAAKINLE